MLRKSHKKSRKGCQACKISHKKCDETHPSCLQCTTTKTQCIYSTTTRKAIKDNFVPYTPSDESRSSNPSIAASSPQSLTLPPTPPRAEPYVNILHLELFQNAMSGAMTFGTEGGMTDEYISVVHKYTFAYPYLMTSALAFSALHLSITRPQNAPIYLTESRILQSQALTLFNASVPTFTQFPPTHSTLPQKETQAPDTINLIPTFLFSSLLGLHFFTTTFSTPHQNLDAFLDALVQSINLLRGVHVLIGDSWESIKTSDIAPLLQTDDAPIDRNDEVTRAFEDLLKKFTASAVLSASDLEAYTQAVTRLIWVYNSQPQTNIFDGPPNARTVVAWPITLSAAYTRLLDARKPEALVVMAYFSILLHSRRSFWAVGEGGRFLLSAIHEHMGPDWVEWLDTPKRMVLG
ncbi:hypothetical protein BJ875DRAFT_502340 [Amylocarpus encephaloides]|uniref:Zn(2)-C6 fungal-type domain-containing protein n=1 Tax=Amylocarpus encephaloides TaxID=45428 RepID=A0A9P7YQU3_9HELO|nr:hypothetical protein BJ875DRAFT_502340 [Amylocarpus encephaloides]